MISHRRRLRLVAFAHGDDLVLWPNTRAPEEPWVPEHLKGRPCIKLLSAADNATEKGQFIRFRTVSSVRLSDPLLVLDEGSKVPARQQGYRN